MNLVGLFVCSAFDIFHGGVTAMENGSKKRSKLLIRILFVLVWNVQKKCGGYKKNCEKKCWKKNQYNCFVYKSFISVWNVCKSLYFYKGDHTKKCEFLPTLFLHFKEIQIEKIEKIEKRVKMQILKCGPHYFSSLSHVCLNSKLFQAALMFDGLGNREQTHNFLICV